MDISAVPVEEVDAMKRKVCPSCGNVRPAFGSDDNPLPYLDICPKCFVNGLEAVVRGLP